MTSDRWEFYVRQKSYISSHERKHFAKTICIESNEKENWML